MTTRDIDDLCSEMPHLNINIEPKTKINPDAPADKHVVSKESDIDSPVYEVTPHYTFVSSDDNSHILPFYPPKRHNHFPWEVFLSI